MKRVLFGLGIFLLALTFCKKDKPSGPQFGTVTDVEGNVYKTVKIGDQWWMAENLKSTKYNDNTPILNIIDDLEWKNSIAGAYCNYNNDPEHSKAYGRLYNWYAVNTGKLAPAGWHVATDADWTALANALGGASDAGPKLKESGIAHWNSPNAGATNSSGFTALPGGYRGTSLNSTAFFSIGNSANWWTATQGGNNSNTGVGYYLYPEAEVYRDEILKFYGFSVRCVKD